MIKIRSMSSNLGSALSEVEFTIVDETHPLQKEIGRYTATVEGRFIDASDPNLIAAVEAIVAEVESTGGL